MTALLGLLTLRHRIAKTGANTLEGYMHPRQLAFGVGVLALTVSLKNRWVWTGRALAGRGRDSSDHRALVWRVRSPAASWCRRRSKTGPSPW